MKFFPSFVALAIAASTANAAYLGHYESTAAPYSKYSSLQQSSLSVPAWAYLDGDRVCEGVRTVCNANNSPDVCDLYFQRCIGLPNGQNKYGCTTDFVRCGASANSQGQIDNCLLDYGTQLSDCPDRNVLTSGAQSRLSYIMQSKGSAKTMPPPGSILAANMLVLVRPDGYCPDVEAVCLQAQGSPALCESLHNACHKADNGKRPGCAQGDAEGCGDAYKACAGSCESKLDDSKLYECMGDLYTCVLSTSFKGSDQYCVAKYKQCTFTK
ncbi:hypothetical protein K488DRAFT_75320 [Vararia minispora EC-137]|uniref:Uncharacterized protein n=1 Tax=Vararia minispora EC-137 TaxID=1314806 RepID=A0ACB8Q408_9AGAM|nr:hypothetical protein K488DRAFT_75320 [Vararia minispora EC-137]